MLLISDANAGHIPRLKNNAKMSSYSFLWHIFLFMSRNGHKSLFFFYLSRYF